MGKIKDVGHKIEDEFNKDVNLVAEKTHMKPWYDRKLIFASAFFISISCYRMVLTIVGVIVVVVLGLIGWCIWRFCKKKRPKGAEDGKDKQDDENALVDNEEANIEEVSAILAWRICTHFFRP